MAEGLNELKTGTTTVGIVCKDGVVMGTERRATAGTFIAHKKTQKLFQIDDHISLTVAGLVGDAQMLARVLRAEVELYKMKCNQEISVKAAATLTSNILSQQRYVPYWVQLLLGGTDTTGRYVYSLDAAGGSISDEYVATGSGSPYVYGILEDYYQKDVTVEQGVDLIIRGISAAMKRDSASGDGIDVAVITDKDGFRKLEDDEILDRKKQLA
jgi:proteasome beta subunit